jgi:hypothetical protein
MAAVVAVEAAVAAVVAAEVVVVVVVAVAATSEMSVPSLVMIQPPLLRLQVQPTIPTVLAQPTLRQLPLLLPVNVPIVLVTTSILPMTADARSLASIPVIESVMVNDGM